MPPINRYDNWNKRATDSYEKIEPYRRYNFICEGKNTESWYFQRIVDIQKKLGVHSTINVVLWEKTDEHKNISNPKSLIEFANKQKQDPKLKFDCNRDKMIIIFDADIFETQQSNYNQILNMGRKDNIIGVTNPSFELFLLLHKENAVETLVEPNKEKLVKNEWIVDNSTRVRYVEHLFRQTYGLKPKKDTAIGELANHVLTAIEEEEKINTNIDNCKGIVTSNVGQIIQSIIDDHGE